MTSVGLGFFPLDQQLELWEKHWSAGLAKEAVWLSGRVSSFEQAEETLARIGHVAMADSTIWRRVAIITGVFPTLPSSWKKKATKQPIEWLKWGRWGQPKRKQTSA